jgi:alpha-2-macroglobulin-like protein
MSRTRTSIAVFVACSVTMSMLAVISSQATVSPGAGESTDDHKATTQKLGGADRCLTYISTDRPIYRTGDKVFFRGVTLNASNHKPIEDIRPVNATVQIMGPKGEVVGGGTAVSKDSVWSFSWQVPPGQAGGEYTIHATYPWQGFSPGERKFDVRAYRAPRLNSHITFLRDGYGPGEKVTATLEVKRAEGGVPEGAKVSVSAIVDGTPIDGGVAKVDAKGLCTASFDLPSEISRGEGTLALVIQDGGVVETAAKTIPILLKTVDIQMFPEGGDLIAGYKNRVYVQALQPNGKPADLVADVVSDQANGKNATIVQFKTEHEGRGRFDFTPDANRQYSLRILKPVGIKKEYALPKVKSEGAVIRADKDVYKKGQPINVQIGCTQKKFRVTVMKRETELASHDYTTKHRASKFGGLNPVALTIPSDADGVLIVTVWGDDGKPLAERLIFREQAKPLTIKITPDKTAYVPGDKAKVTIKATDSAGKPVSAVIGITVADDSVLQMVEKREQAPRLPVMVFLEQEVKDLADAHVYLDPANPKAPIATDLLLGTQGWRRFALIDMDKFVLANGDDARRVLALKTDIGWGPMGGSGALPIAAAGAGGIAIRGGDFAKLAMVPPPPPAQNAAGPKVVAMALPSRAQQLDGVHQHFAKKADDNEENLKALPNDFREVVRGPRDVNMFQVAPKVATFSAEAAERQQKIAPDLGGGMDKLQGAASGAAVGKPVPQIAALDMGMPVAAAPGFARRGGMMVMNGAFMHRPRGSAWVREFAHQVRPDRKPNDRIDFAETLYWNAGVKTDPKTGEGTIAFGLNDSVTTFQVFADGFASDGSLGAATVGLKAIQPFYAEAKLPLEVTAGDKILLPISLINGTVSALQDANVSVDLADPFKLLPILKPLQGLNAGERSRCILPIEVGFGQGLKDLVLHARAGAYQDKVVRQLSVKPSGFPIEKAFGGILEPDKPVLLKITIEKNVVLNSLKANASVYPSPLANMTGALERMIQDPNGCFEQTSSTSYPLTMAQQYFLSHSGVDPKLVEKSREKLDAGYKHLVSFWCPDRGYEWFGQNPGHEALTAFGLLHFNDMAKVRDVDQDMVATTRTWLLNQKDGKGGFTRKARSLHTWIEDKDCSNAYIVWALLETGQKASELKPELDSLKTAADASQNNYVVALAANSFELSGDKAEAKKLMQRLAAKQKTDGSVDGVTSSIVGSGGESLEVEGTALASLAWEREPEFKDNAGRTIKFLADSCKAGRYGSTQATVLALRSIVTYDKQQARPKVPGKVRLFADGQPIGDWIAFDQTTQEAIKLPDLSEILSPGDHNLELRMDGGSPMPYAVAVKYNTITPESDQDCKLNLSAKLAQDKLVEGTSTDATVTVTNTTAEAVPTPIAIIGLPGGLEPRHDQLKELVKRGTIDAYEVLGREVVLYWRSLPANAKVQVPISVIAAIPGSYTGPASRAYLYYTDEHKKWVDGLHVEIAAKN